jgi:hypothetical protein
MRTLLKNKLRGKYKNNQSVALTIKKIANSTAYNAAGQHITYTYNVTNPGNMAIRGPITVTYNKTVTVTIITGNRTPGKNVTGIANYTMNQADLDNILWSV